MAAIYLGGCLRALCVRGAAERPKSTSDPGVLAASGLVAGEGLAGVVVAALVAGGLVPKNVTPHLEGFPGEIAILASFALVSWFLYRAGQNATPAPNA
jgi:hypothetical protein